MQPICIRSLFRISVDFNLAYVITLCFKFLVPCAAGHSIDYTCQIIALFIHCNEAMKISKSLQWKQWKQWNCKRKKKIIMGRLSNLSIKIFVSDKSTMKAYLSRQINDKSTMKKTWIFSILTLKKSRNLKFFEKVLH